MEQFLELESLGILRTTRVPAELAWMSDETKRFVLELHMAGEEGVHKRLVNAFSKKNPDAVLQMEIKQLVEWLSDKAGRPTFLALTWKGTDAAQLLLSIAKNESRKNGNAPWERGNKA